MRTDVIAVVLGLGVCGLGGYAAFQHNQIKNLALANEAADVINKMNQTDQGKCYMLAEDTRKKLEACEAIVNQPSQPTGSWWCYRERECFSSQDKCVHAGKDDDRSVECVSSVQVWCGGKDGHTCFAEACDCRALEASGGQPCVLAR
jgi:hypothetical protein